MLHTAAVQSRKTTDAVSFPLAGAVLFCITHIQKKKNRHRLNCRCLFFLLYLCVLSAIPHIRIMHISSTALYSTVRTFNPIDCKSQKQSRNGYRFLHAIKKHPKWLRPIRKFFERYGTVPFWGCTVSSFLCDEAAVLWISRNYFHHRPDFLFGWNSNHSHCRKINIHFHIGKFPQSAEHQPQIYCLLLGFRQGF